MLKRVLLIGLAGCSLVAGSSVAEASHPFQGSGQLNINYLYRNLEVPTGIGKIFYSLCGTAPNPASTHWRTAVEAWDNAFGNWQFDELACGSNVNTRLAWENAADGACSEEFSACWLNPQFTGLYTAHGSHRDLTQGIILFDVAKYNGLPNADWRLTVSVHEWGHNMSLADHHNDDICDDPPATRSVMDGDPDSLCPLSPTTADVNSVRCNVYHLCAGVRVAAADVDGDGCDEIITAPGPGLDAWVRVWDALVGPCITSTSGVFVRAQFLAYSSGFEGGVYVSGGNVDSSTSRDEIITGAGAGGEPSTKIFSMNPLTSAITSLTGFWAYEQAFRGGVRVGGGDVVCGGDAEILTSPGPVRDTDIRTWDFAYPPSLVAGFDAYGAFNNGAFVAGGNLSTTYCGDEIVTGADAGGTAHVRVFCCASGSQVLASFLAYSSGFSGGARVGAGNHDSDSQHEIITGAGPGGEPSVKVFNTDQSQITGFWAYAQAYRGGVFVASGNVDFGSSTWEIITGADGGGGPHVRVWNCCSGPPTEIRGWMAWPY